MGLRDVTHEAVIAAAAEFDELGRAAFLSKYGFDRARAYLLIHGGNLPALYQPITVLWAIGRAYRGEPRIENWETTRLHCRSA